MNNPSLIELDACFITDASEAGHRETKSFSDAQGVRFLCPLCFVMHGEKPEGVHSILIWFDGVPGHILPGPGRWKKSGTGISNLTLQRSVNLDTRRFYNPNMPPEMVLVGDGCRWHGYIRNGRAEGGMP